MEWTRATKKKIAVYGHSVYFSIFQDLLSGWADSLNALIASNIETKS